MARFDVIESLVWKRDDGRSASPYGAVPWTSPAEEKRWQLVKRGYTVRNNERGTIGIGRQPWATRAEAQEWVDKEEARLAEIAAYHERMRKAAPPSAPKAKRSKRGHHTTKKTSTAQIERDIVETSRVLSPAQERLLLRKHLTGDIGKHAWSTIESLIANGYLADRGGRLEVTPKGKSYCDAHHMRMSL